MSSASIDTLGGKAASYAINAALAYLRQQGQLTVAVCDRLSVALKAECRAALPVALEDAKQALACGMGDAASATFALTMAEAGVKAAKAVMAPDLDDEIETFTGYSMRR